MFNTKKITSLMYIALAMLCNELTAMNKRNNKKMLPEAQNQETDVRKKLRSEQFNSGEQSAQRSANRNQVNVLLHQYREALRSALQIHELVQLTLNYLPNWLYFSKLNYHTGWISAIQFSEDSRSVTTFGTDIELITWELGSNEIGIKNAEQDKRTPIFSAALSNNSDYFAYIKPKKRVCIYQRLPNENYNRQDYFATKAEQLALSSSGRFLATNEAIYMRNNSSYEIIGQLLDQKAINALSFSRDETLLVTSNNYRLYIYGFDAQSNSFNFKFTLSFPGSYSIEFKRVLFSPDNTYIAAVGKNHTGDGDSIVYYIVIWKRTSAKELQYQEMISSGGHGKSINSLAFSPDSTMLASCSDDKTIRIWHLDNNEKEFLGESEEALNGLAFSPHGLYLASGDKNKNLHIWIKQRLSHQKTNTPNNQQPAPLLPAAGAAAAAAAAAAK